MIWLWLLSNWRMLAVGGLIAIPSGYAAIQKVRLDSTKAEYAQYRANIAALAAAAEIRNAQEALRQEQNTREVLDGLQTRYDVLSARYDGLRKRPAGPSSRPVPAATSTAPAPSPGPSGQPDAATRCVPEGHVLAVLEAGDRELAKYRELWNLQQKNLTP